MSTQTIHPAVAYYQSTGTLPSSPTPAAVNVPGTDVPIFNPSAIGSGGVTDTKGSLQNPLDTLSQAGSILHALTSPGLWIRIGQFLLGGLLLLIGVYLMASESAAGQRLKSQAETAAVVAAA